MKEARNDVNYGSITEINDDVAAVDVEDSSNNLFMDDPNDETQGFLCTSRNSDSLHHRRSYGGNKYRGMFVIALASALVLMIGFLGPDGTSTSAVRSPAAAAATTANSVSRVENAGTILSNEGRVDAFDWSEWGSNMKEYWQTKFEQWKDGVTGFWNDHKDDRPNFNTKETVDHIEDEAKDFWNSAVTTFDEAVDATKAKFQGEKEEVEQKQKKKHS